MGCHTWFYTKINPQPTYNEIKEDVLNRLNETVDFYDRMILGDIDSDLLEVYPEWTPEYGEKGKLITQRQIRIVEQDLCKEAIYNRYRQDDFESLITNIKGIFYKETDYHDLFRKYKYPSDKLFSLQETLDYIEKYKEEVTVYQDTFEKLKQFWSEYPEGMIDFG